MDGEKRFVGFREIRGVRFSVSLCPVLEQTECKSLEASTGHNLLCVDSDLIGICIASEQITCLLLNSQLHYTRTCNNVDLKASEYYRTGKYL